MGDKPYIHTCVCSHLKQILENKTTTEKQKDMDKVYTYMQTDMDSTMGAALGMAEHSLVSIFILRL